MSRYSIGYESEMWLKVSILLLTLILASCSDMRQSSAVEQDSVPGADESESISSSDEDLFVPSNFDAYQDSLRTVLLNSKPDNFLIGGVLEELYIRGLIFVSYQKLSFTLPFDLHGYDCSAPDCYSTDLSFSFSHNNELVFPDQLEFTVHEYGCIPSEYKVTGMMKLIEESKDFVNYYSPEYRSNLVILGEDQQKQYLYYFTEVSPDSIKAASIHSLLLKAAEDNPSTLAPYRSTVMITGYDD